VISNKFTTAVAIGSEELSHLEVAGTLARLHLAPMKNLRDAAEADPPMQFDPCRRIQRKHEVAARRPE
jgi:Mn-containing catalase